jgi:hypothetical protein
MIRIALLSAHAILTSDTIDAHAFGDLALPIQLHDFFRRHQTEWLTIHRPSLPAHDFRSA